MAGQYKGSTKLDAASSAIIYEGANLSEMSVMFKCDHRVLKEKINAIPQIKPCGKRGQADIYPIHEVAARMGKLSDEQVHAAMRHMNHADLPKALSKEYWAGLRSKQEYELKAGQLWPTDKVVGVLGDIFKLVKMSVLLTMDAVERNQELPPRVRDVMKRQMDGLLKDVQGRVQEYASEAKAQELLPPTEVANGESSQDADDDEI